MLVNTINFHILLLGMSQQSKQHLIFDGNAHIHRQHFNSPLHFHIPQ